MCLMPFPRLMSILPPWSGCTLIDDVISFFTQDVQLQIVLAPHCVYSFLILRVLIDWWCNPNHVPGCPIVFCARSPIIFLYFFLGCSQINDVNPPPPKKKKQILCLGVVEDWRCDPFLFCFGCSITYCTGSPLFYICWFYWFWGC